VEARTLLAHAALTTGDLFEATALATEVLNDRPSAPGASLIIAWGHVVRGQEAAARDLLSNVVTHTLWEDATARALHATLDIRGRTRGIVETVTHALSGPDPTGWYFFPQLAELLAHVHLYQELDQVLTLALDRDPTNFYSRSAYALNLLRLGDDDEGLRQMELAWDGDKFNERTFNTRALFRDVVAYEYKLVRRDGVELRLPKNAAPVLAEQLFHEIAAARRTFERRYKLEIPNVRVEVYRTPREFAVRTIGVPALGALGVCFGPVVTIVGPFSGRFNFSRVLWHELAHTYALAASQRRVPRWFTEGLSEWEAGQRAPGWRATIAEELATIDSDGALVPLSQLEGAFVLAENHQAMSQAYMQATAAVEFLMTKLDDASLRDTLAAFHTGRPAVDVLPTILRTSMNQLDAEYARWVKDTVAGAPGGWEPPADDANAVDARVALWEAANEALQRGDFRGSLQQIDLLEDADGEGYASAMLRGIALRETGAIPAAIRALERAEDFTDARSEHLILRARLARNAGDATEEQNALDAVFERDFSNAEAAARLIVLSLAGGDGAPKPHHLERLQQIAPTSPRTLGARALALAATDQRRRANALLDLGLALDPTDADSLTLLALAARACRRPDDARDSASLALQHPRISPVTRALITTTWPALSRLR
jgi:Tfp pilus assembly protein PilF